MAAYSPLSSLQVIPRSDVQEQIRKFKLHHLLRDLFEPLTCMYILECLLPGPVDLTRLRVESKGINDEQARMVANILRETRTITKLILQSTWLCARGTSIIADGLRDNSTIDYVNLMYNGCSDEGAFAIARVIKSNFTIKTLYLSNNRLQSDGAAAIADALTFNSTLIKLDLSRNDIDERGIAALRHAVSVNTTLRSLNISKNRMKRKRRNFFKLCCECRNYEYYDKLWCYSSNKLNNQPPSKYYCNSLKMTRIYDGYNEQLISIFTRISSTHATPTTEWANPW